MLNGPPDRTVSPGLFDDVITPLIKKSKYLGLSPETRKEKRDLIDKLKVKQA